jgi:hypothetical protein
VSRPTPVRDGFGAIGRQLSVYFAEIAWRWSFGGAALGLGWLALYEYSQTLFVSRADLLLLSTRHPVLVGRALADIFRGSGPRLVAVAIILPIALAVFWSMAAALGRRESLRALLARTAPEVVPSLRLRPLLGLSFLRVTLLLALLASLLGAGILAGFLSSAKAPHPGLVFLAFLPLAGFVALTWAILNWFLSLAALFVVRDGCATFSALSAAVDFCRRRTGMVAAASFWFGLFHLIAFGAGSTLAMYPLSLASLVPGRVTLLLLALVTLVYFAVVDFLYIARLAAYIAAVEWDRRPPEPAPAGPAPAEPAPGWGDDEPLFALPPPSSFPGGEMLPQS